MRIHVSHGFVRWSGLSGAVCAWRGVGREDESKPDAAIMVVMRYLITFRHRAVNRPIVETPTAKNPFISRTNEGRTVQWNAPDVACKDILAPFPNVARHVIDAELILRLLPHWLRVIAVLPD